MYRKRYAKNSPNRGVFLYSLFDSLSGFPYNENAIAKVYDLEEFYEPYRKNPHSP